LCLWGLGGSLLLGAGPCLAGPLSCCCLRAAAISRFCFPPAHPSSSAVVVVLRGLGFGVGEPRFPNVTIHSYTQWSPETPRRPLRSHCHVVCCGIRCEVYYGSVWALGWLPTSVTPFYLSHGHFYGQKWMLMGVISSSMRWYSMASHVMQHHDEYENDDSYLVGI
jgi:hypothetical protein